MAKRSVGKPRFYAPLDQYLKAKGYYRGAALVNTEPDFDYEENQNLAKNVWNLNPAQPTTIGPDVIGAYGALIFEFYINTNLPTNYAEWDSVLPAPNKELTALLKKRVEVADESKSGFYIAALGHNLAGDLPTGIRTGYWGQIEDGTTVASSNTNWVDGVNMTNIGTGSSANYPVPYNGYSIGHFKSFTQEDNEFASSVFRVNFDYNPNYQVVNDNPNASINMGGVSWGRWFEPEHSLDLQATITDSYDGIKTQTTIGGNTLTNINYLSHDWGDLPAWTLEKQEGNDYKIGGRDGRRQWKVSLSYLQDDDLFHSVNNENQFFSYDDETDDYTFDASMSSFFKMTLMGKLPFIFNPDSSATNKEFAICRITNKPSFKQVANNLFSTNLVITEVF